METTVPVETVTSAPVETALPAGALGLTDAAAIKVKELLARETSATELGLRVAVQPGGCSGLRYALYFDDEIKETDVVAESSGVRLIVDKMSAPYLKGAKVDYLDSLQQSGFTIDNPNAQGSCACGESFH